VTEDESTIILEVDYVPADMREAMRINSKRHLRTFKWIVIACFFAIFLLFALLLMSLHASSATAPSTSANSDAWSMLLRMGIFFVAMFCVIFVFRLARRGLTKRIINERGPMQRPHLIEMTSQHLICTEPLARHEYDWDAFNRWIETGNLLILYLSANLVIVLPKRCIGTPERIEQCRQFFRAKIDSPRTARHAFEVLPANVLPIPPLPNDPSLPR